MSNARKSRSKRERYAALCANEGVCPVYNEPMKLWESHCDHIVPLAVGGKDDWDNIISVNAQVNMGKSSGRFPDGLTNKLLAKAAKNKPCILELLDDPDFQVPHHISVKVDLNKIHIDEIMADIGATVKWSFYQTKKLISEYLKRGVDYLYKIAREIGKTITACISKLANLQLYNNQFQGQGV